MRKMKTLEFALWKIKSGKVEFEILGIYHPPGQPGNFQIQPPQSVTTSTYHLSLQSGQMG